MIKVLLYLVGLYNTYHILSKSSKPLTDKQVIAKYCDIGNDGVIRLKY